MKEKIKQILKNMSLISKIAIFIWFALSVAMVVDIQPDVLVFPMVIRIFISLLAFVFFGMYIIVPVIGWEYYRNPALERNSEEAKRWRELEKKLAKEERERKKKVQEEIKEQKRKEEEKQRMLKEQQKAAKRVHRNSYNSRFGVNLDDVDSVDFMDGHLFEHFCAALLSDNGYVNVKVTRGSGDQGVDIICNKNGQKYAIQCKNFQSHLGNKPVQEVFAGKTYYNCDVAVVMTNSFFTNGAIDLARRTNVELWDRKELAKMMRNV